MSEADHWQKKIAIEQFLCLVKKLFICRNLKLTFHFWSIWLYNLDDIDIIDYVLYTEIQMRIFLQWAVNGNMKMVIQRKLFIVRIWIDEECQGMYAGIPFRNFLFTMGIQCVRFVIKGNPTFCILSFDIFVNRS